MHREIKIHISDVKKFTEDINNGLPFIHFGHDDVYMQGFEAEPIADCDLPEHFPLCCSFHKGVAKNVFSWYKNFPNCCDYHKELSKKSWFSKQNFDSVPSKVVKNLFYTTNFIRRNIHSDDWYEDITNYVEYIFHSFGSPAIGANLYIQYLSHYIEHVKFDENDFPYKKRMKVIKLVKDYGRTKRQRTTDLNVLYVTFQKWLKSLPNLIMFQNIKQSMSDKMPMNMVLYNEKYNPYLQLAKSKIRTNREFILTLTDYTKGILKNMNVANLIRDGVIDDKDKYKFDLISEKHRNKQDRLVTSYDVSELEYIRIIKTWLKNEEIFFKEIYPMFNSIVGTNKKQLNVNQNNVDVENKISEQEEEITLFISYYWEDEINEDHKSWVRNLADILIHNRINVILDQYELKLGGNMIHFMENSISIANKIIIVFTPGYKLKANNKNGGVGYEYSIINASMYKNQIENNVIPVLRMGEREDSIPDFMHQYVGIDMRKDNKFDESVEEILRDLYNKPKLRKPPLGNKPMFN